MYKEAQSQKSTKQRDLDNKSGRKADNQWLQRTVSQANCRPNEIEWGGLMAGEFQNVL